MVSTSPSLASKGKAATHLRHLLLARDFGRHEDSHVMLSLAEYIVGSDQELDVAYFETSLF